MRKAIVNAVMIAALAGATIGMSTLSLAATMGLGPDAHGSAGL
jgi:hypothetical protein